MTFFIITLLFLVSVIFAEFFFHFKYPRVIGYIIAGIFIGLPFFQRVLGVEVLTIVEFMSELGVMFLFLLIGLEVDLDKFKKSSREALYVGALAFIVPFIIGFGVMYWLDFSVFVSLVVALALSISAEATTAQVLIELKAIKSRVGNILIGAGLIDDLIGVFLLTFFLSFQDGTSISHFPLKFAGFIALIWISFRLISMLMHHLERDNSSVSSFSFILVFSLLIASAAEWLGFGGMIGAFTAGLIVNFFSSHECTDECSKKCRHKAYAKIQKTNIEELKLITLSFVIPFFFIYTGLHFDLLHIGDHIGLVFGITAVALIGKFLGVYLAKFFTGMKPTEAYIVAWGMNSRGAVELVIAQIALDAGLIGDGLYTALVSMALISTLAFPFFMKRSLKPGFRFPKLSSP